MRANEFLTEGDKMSSINLAQALANTPPVWKKFISSLPPQLAREFVDERPVPNQEDIDWFTPLRLKSPQPVAVSVADLLRHPENQGSIGRSPDDVIDAVNQQWGLKIPSGKKYDPNPARYRAYAQMTPGTASPSVAVDGVIIFGAGRFVAAALRGDKTMRVWDMTREQGVTEGKITLSTDPNWYGATVDNYQASGPVVNIPANQLVGFEPDDKMNQPKSKVNVEKIVAGLKQGAKLPPLLVRKYKNGYQVLDGHHRFWAYKLLGVKSIPAQIVPDSDIEEISKQGVAEGQLNELDLFAPVTTFIKMTDGSYIQADWRKSQGNPGLSDSASFVNFKPVNPNVAKQLGLDSYQRNNSISNHRDGTIVPGGPIQGSGPLANRGYEVVDYNKPETMKELPPEIKSELIKWIQKQGVAEGLDDPWGDQGNFAGDKPVNIGGDTVKQLQVGDIVTYFGQKARIEAMSKTGNTSRITIANKMGGTTQDVLTRDLKRTGISEENGGVGGGFGTNYPGTYEQENGPFTHKGGLKLTSLTTESVDYLDEK